MSYPKPTFDCGHEGDFPRNMGRGAARTRRLADYFGRRCPSCAIEHLRRYAEALTHVDATPLTPVEREQYIARRLPGIMSTY